MSKEVKFERLVIGSDIFSYGDVLLSAIAKYLNPDISIEKMVLYLRITMQTKLLFSIIVELVFMKNVDKI